MKNITLLKHQQDVVDKNPEKYLLAHSTGTGKTITSISLAEKNCKTCLVIVPKSLKGQWIETITNLECKASYTVTTKEEFKKQCLTIAPHDGVIIDEAHYFAGQASQLTKALKWYLKKHDIKYRWLCTATPYLSTPWNVYTLAELLGKEMNYWTFKQQFFFDMKMGARVISRPKESAIARQELVKIVQSLGSTVDMKEVVDVPEQTFETETFQPTHDQVKAIAEMKRDTTDYIVKWTKQHQIENGFLYGDNEWGIKTKHIECDKTKRILELVSDNKTIAIFMRYNHQIEYIKQQIIDNLGTDRNIYVINGANDDRYGTVNAINADESPIVLIQATCSAGYELPYIDTAVFASLSFSHVDHIQAMGRFLRINKLKSNRYIYLVTDGVDSDVYNCIMNKQDFHISIYDKKV